MSRPSSPVGRRDCCAMNSGRRMAGSPTLIAEDGAQTEDVGHAGPDEGRGEAQGEIVDAGDAASGDDDAVSDPHGRYHEARERHKVTQLHWSASRQPRFSV